MSWLMKGLKIEDLYRCTRCRLDKNIVDYTERYIKDLKKGTSKTSVSCTSFSLLKKR